jgi:inner membrane protein
VDNVCHTLVGAALGRAGLNRRTRFGSATLMIAANLPDVDVLVFATGMPSVAFRRGWTHGVLAQVLLPVVLTAAVALVARSRARTAPAPAAAGTGPPLSVPWLFALSVIGVYSHVGLDYLNSYGVRLLTPLDWRWFYGDAAFIVDPWMWAALGAGVWVARRTQRRRPALVAVACVTVYVTALLLSARSSRALVLDAWQRQHGRAPVALMVGPRPLTPLTREIIIDTGREYETGLFRWPSGEVLFAGTRTPKNDQHPAVALAREAPDVRGFLVWSRFPFWTIEETPDGRVVTVHDMRFGDRFAASARVR